MERFYVSTKLKGAAGFALIKSFKEDCEKIGWIYKSDFTPFSVDMFDRYYPDLFFSGDFDDTKAPKMALTVGSGLTAHFCLEEEYELALKQAKIVYEKITAAPKIQPKRGDYMFVRTKENKREWMYIASGSELNPTDRICSYPTDCPKVFVRDGGGIITNPYDIAELRHATPEEKEVLDEALWNLGYVFNTNTLNVESIPKLGELCIFWNGDSTRAVIGTVKGTFPGGILGVDMKTYKDWVPFTTTLQYLGMVREGA